jgi:hypothetical protein
MPRRMRWRVIWKRSSRRALSHEAEVGVKWKVQRGCGDSQANTPASARAGFWDVCADRIDGPSMGHGWRVVRVNEPSAEPGCAGV